MVAAHHFALASMLLVCCAPAPGPVEAPLESAQRTQDFTGAVSASPMPAASAMDPPSEMKPSSSAEVVSNPIAMSKGPCFLPAKRPASFGVKQVQHQLPIGRPSAWFGSELATQTNVCPRDESGLTPPCRRISEVEMESIYRRLVDGKFCALRPRSPSEGTSPHYGSHTITVFIGEHWFEVTDSSHSLLVAASRKRFYELFDLITSVAAQR